jgi:hypothetical protein
MDIQTLLTNFTDKFKEKYKEHRTAVLASVRQEDAVEEAKTLEEEEAKTLEEAEAKTLEEEEAKTLAEEPVVPEQDKTRADIVAAVVAAVLSTKAQLPPAPPPVQNNSDENLLPLTKLESPENIVAATVAAVLSAPKGTPKQTQAGDNSAEKVAATVAAVLSASQGTSINKPKTDGDKSAEIVAATVAAVLSAAQELVTSTGTNDIKTADASTNTDKFINKTVKFAPSTQECKADTEYELISSIVLSNGNMSNLLVTIDPTELAPNGMVPILIAAAKDPNLLETIFEIRPGIDINKKYNGITIQDVLDKNGHTSTIIKDRNNELIELIANILLSKPENITSELTKSIVQKKFMLNSVITFNLDGRAIEITPLMIACTVDNAAIVKSIVDKLYNSRMNCNVDYINKNINEVTALSIATKNKNNEIIKILSEKQTEYAKTVGAANQIAKFKADSNDTNDAKQVTNDAKQTKPAESDAATAVKATEAEGNAEKYKAEAEADAKAATEKINALEKTNKELQKKLDEQSKCLDTESKFNIDSLVSTGNKPRTNPYMGDAIDVNNRDNEAKIGKFVYEGVGEQKGVVYNKIDEKFNNPQPISKDNEDSVAESKSIGPAPVPESVPVPESGSVPGPAVKRKRNVNIKSAGKVPLHKINKSTLNKINKNAIPSRTSLARKVKAAGGAKPGEESEDDEESEVVEESEDDEESKAGEKSGAKPAPKDSTKENIVAAAVSAVLSATKTKAK